MNTMIYDNEKYMKVTERSALRPHTKDRIKVLTIAEDGTIQSVSRTVPPVLHKSVSHTAKDVLV